MKTIICLALLVCIIAAQTDLIKKDDKLTTPVYPEHEGDLLGISSACYSYCA